MKTHYTRKRLPSAASIETASEKIIMEKMGLSPEEYREINDVYGVSATRLLELMQLSKYAFIFPLKTPGKCDICQPQVRKGAFFAQL
ncbi:MAG: hypothetical protein ACXVMS_12130 [Flavisolibacter sp.]